MLRNTLFAALLASSTLTLAVAPAAAGTSDRAREAIAAAEAKLHTAESLGAATDSPRETAQARALLASAHEDFKTDHREHAIQEAIQAQALADTAIGLAQKHRDQALASAHESERATADAARAQIAAAKDQAAQAQDQAAAAQDQSAAAQQQAAQAKQAAQQQVADANARADAAQQAAAASAADAAAARNAATLAAQTPPKVETTVTTATNTRHPVRRKVVKTTTTTAPAPATSEQVTTTTKVTPQQ